MQVIHQNEDKGNNSGGANIMGTILYTERISRYLEGKCIGGFGRRTIGIWNSWRILDRYKERVQRRRQEISESSQTQENRVGK